MPPTLTPFAFIRLLRADRAASHLLVTPTRVAFVTAFSDRVYDASDTLQRIDAGVLSRDLVAYARGEQPLVVGPDQVIHAVALDVAPATTRVEIAAANICSSSSDVLLDILVAWRATELVPQWSQVEQTLVEIACDAACPDVPLEAHFGRDSDDACVLALTSAASGHVITATFSPSIGHLHIWVHREHGRWVSTEYSKLDDGTWLAHAAEGSAPQRLESLRHVAFDAVRNCDGRCADQIVLLRSASPAEAVPESALDRINIFVRTLTDAVAPGSVRATAAYD